MSLALPVIEVLIATYNGERFLREQIDSVLAQQGVAVRMLARDDGSSDGTAGILAEYAEAYGERFRVLPADRPTGAAQHNFHQLLLASSGDYVAFCDQDDVWLPDKLHHTLVRMQQLEAVHSNAVPLLVSSDLRVVDEALQTIAPSLWRQNGLAHAESPALGQLLAENTVTGCTALLNRALVERMGAMPHAVLMHDHWAALIAASTGALAAIPEATVLYRQHSANVVGAVASRSPFETVQRLLGRDAVEDRAVQYCKDRAQAGALLAIHGSSMQPAKRETVAAFLALNDLGRIQRLRTMQRNGLWRSGLARKLAAITDILRS